MHYHRTNMEQDESGMVPAFSMSESLCNRPNRLFFLPFPILLLLFGAPLLPVLIFCGFTVTHDCMAHAKDDLVKGRIVTGWNTIPSHAKLQFSPEHSRGALPTLGRGPPSEIGATFIPLRTSAPMRKRVFAWW